MGRESGFLRTMVISRNMLALAALFALEAIIFYAQFAEQISPYYPRAWDQLEYFIDTYLLLGSFFTDGWRGLFSQVGNAPQGVTFPIQGAVLALVGGINRTSMASVNLAYFLILQAMMYWTVWSRTGRAYLAWISISLILSLVTVFHSGGGIYDYRIDFSVMCLYGIWVCAILSSDMFTNRWWSVAVGGIGALLVSMRFISLVYVGPILLLAFCILVATKLRDRARTNQVINCFMSGVVILVVSTPLLFLARHVIVQYYVVGHVTGSENVIRAAELGIKDFTGHLLYYPTSILCDHLGFVALLISCLSVVVALAFGVGRRESSIKYQNDLMMLAISTVIPVAVFTADMSKSPVVGNTVSVPIILFVVLLASSSVPRLVGTSLASVSMVLALAVFLSHATAPQHFMSRADLQTVDRLASEVTKYVAASGIDTPSFAFDRVDDYLNVPMIRLRYLEASDPRRPTPMNMVGSMGGIFAISTDAAIQAVKSSDVVVITDQFKGRETPYPFNESMKESWPQIAEYAEKNLLEIASGRISDIPYRIFAGANVKIEGLSVDNWITDNGIVLSVDSFFLKSRPVIVLEGRIRTDLLRGEPVVKASVEDTTELPSSLTSDGDRYRLKIDASALANGEGKQSIRVRFDRYFIPSQLGINADERKLVIEGPTVRQVEPR
jgi:hypothetical protein